MKYSVIILLFLSSICNAELLTAKVAHQRTIKTNKELKSEEKTAFFYFIENSIDTSIEGGDYSTSIAVNKAEDELYVPEAIAKLKDLGYTTKYQDNELEISW